MRQPSSADPSSVRQWNERAVITALRDAGTVRVAQVAEQVGLSTASTREVLRGLVTKHWVVPEAQSSGSVGRPASMFRLATPPVGLLGLDVGGHRVRGVLDAGSGSVEVLGEVSIEQGVPGVEATRAALVELLAPVDVSGVWMTGLAVSGALDHSDRLDRSIAMADFVGRRPAEVLGSVLPGAVMTLHDTKAALWAERVEGAALGRRDVLYVHLGRRPSLALLLAGQLYRGAHGSAGELSLNELLPASGGYDWVESAGDADAQGRALVAAVEGDPVAVAGAQRFVLDIVPQVAFAAGLVDPELLVLGGALGPVIRPVLDEVRDELDRRLQTPPDVAVGELDEYVTARGAVHLARGRRRKTLHDSEGPLPPLERAALLA